MTKIKRLVPRHIIDIAIKGGYRKDVREDEANLIFLDVLFWEALGTAFGWGKTNNCWGCGYDEGATNNTDIWYIKAHHFFGDVLCGGWHDIDEFWKDIENLEHIE